MKDRILDGLDKFFKIVSPTFGEKTFGFPIKIDSSLTFMMIAYLYFGGWQTTLVVLVIYSTVLLHEFGHIYAAKRLGYKTNSLTMYMIGGAAAIEGLDDDSTPAKDEFWIVLCGPLVNVFLFALTIGIYLCFYDFETIKAIYAEVSSKDPKLVHHFPKFHEYVVSFAYVQFVLVAFNLLPIYPMDGGRLMKTILTPFTKKAKVIASYVAIVVGTGALIYYAFISFSINAVIVMPLIIILNIYMLKKNKKKQQIMRNLPEDIYLVTKYSFWEDEGEYFHGLYRYKECYSYEDIQDNKFPNNLLDQSLVLKTKDAVDKILKSYSYQLVNRVLLLDSASKHVYHYKMVKPTTK